MSKQLSADYEHERVRCNKLECRKDIDSETQAEAVVNKATSRPSPGN